MSPRQPRRRIILLLTAAAALVGVSLAALLLIWWRWPEQLALAAMVASPFDVIMIAFWWRWLRFEEKIWTGVWEWVKR